MSNQYKEWKEDKFAIVTEYYCEFESISKEDLYQELKARLLSEIAGYTPELLNLVMIEDLKPNSN